MHSRLLLSGGRTPLCRPALRSPGRAGGRCRCRGAALPPQANLIPNFPRLVDPVREWLAGAAKPIGLPGFNGEDLTRLLFPDIQSFTSYTLGGALLIAFVYWEGGIILHELQERRRRARLRDAEGEGAGEGASGGPQPPNRPLTPQQQALYERKQGLAWLAIVTAISIWCTGIVNVPQPFQP